MKIKLDKLLKNKMVLYIIFFLALVTIFGYLVKQNYPAILFFTLVIFLTKSFSSNMIVILGIAILATNLLDVFRIFSFRHLENLENMNEKQPSENVKKILRFILDYYLNEEITMDELLDEDKMSTIYKINKDPDSEKKIKEAHEQLEQLNKSIDSDESNLSIPDLDYLMKMAELYKKLYVNAIANNAAGGNASSGDYAKNKENLKNALKAVNKGIELINKIKKEKEKNEKEYQASPNPHKIKDSTDESNDVKCRNDQTYDHKLKQCINKKDTTKASKKEAMSGLSPAEVNSNNVGSGNIPSFDDAKMKENAFDNLEKIFGSDTIRSMTSGTNDLSQRQNVIMDQLKEIGPLMQQAMGLIKNVDMNAINNISDKMGGMIGNLQQLKNENNN